MPDNQLEIVQKVAQDCLNEFPTIVLGSGASAPYGMPTMGELSDNIVRDVEAAIDDLMRADQDAASNWDDFKSALAASGLEMALQKVRIKPQIEQIILQTTWRSVSGPDRAIFGELVAGKTSLILGNLIAYLFRSTRMAIDIVTTNYDRLPEYAAELMGYSAFTGFELGIVGGRVHEPHRNSPKLTYGSTTKRSVNIWKVHGSIDWFESDGQIIWRLPLQSEMPQGCQPVIVTPGIEKYRRTHDEPFRSIMTAADEAIYRAKSYLAVGYGFNDEHIQPKLVEQCVKRGSNIVLLAHRLTDSAHRFLKEQGVKNYTAFESGGENITTCHSNKFEQPLSIPDANLWQLDDFLKFTTQV